MEWKITAPWEFNIFLLLKLIDFFFTGLKLIQEENTVKICDRLQRHWPWGRKCGETPPYTKSAAGTGWRKKPLFFPVKVSAFADYFLIWLPPFFSRWTSRCAVTGWCHCYFMGIWLSNAQIMQASDMPIKCTGTWEVYVRKWVEITGLVDGWKQQWDHLLYVVKNKISTFYLALVI